MEKKKRFPLILRDNHQVRSLEDIQEYFDLEKMLCYLKSGDLYQWLSDRYYEEEAEKVLALNIKSGTLAEELCEMFYIDSDGVPTIAEKYKGKQPRKVSVKNKVIAKKEEEPVKPPSPESLMSEKIENLEEKLEARFKEWEKNPIEEKIQSEIQEKKIDNQKAITQANIAVACACISWCSSAIPFFSIVIAVLGLVFSYKSRKVIKKKRSKVAQVICIIVLAIDVLIMISFLGTSSESNQQTIEETVVKETTISSSETMETETEESEVEAELETESEPQTETELQTESSSEVEVETTEIAESEVESIEHVDEEAEVPSDTAENVLKNEGENQISKTQVASQNEETERSGAEINTIQAGMKFVMDYKPFSTVEGKVEVVINDAYFKDDMLVTERSELSLIEKKLKEGYTAVFIDYTVSILEGDGSIETRGLLADLRGPKKYWGYVNYNDEMTGTMRDKMGMEMTGYLWEGDTFHLVRGFEVPKELLEENAVCTVGFEGNEKISFELIPDQLNDYTGVNPW